VVLALICAAQFVLQLDFSIVNVALPAIKRELGFFFFWEYEVTIHGGLRTHGRGVVPLEHQGAVESLQVWGWSCGHGSGLGHGVKERP